MSNGNYSLNVTGQLDVDLDRETGTRSPEPKPPPPPPSFYIYFTGLFAVIMGVASVVTTGKILFDMVDIEELAFQVVFAIGSGVVTVIALSIGTRSPKEKVPKEPD